MSTLLLACILLTVTASTYLLVLVLHDRASAWWQRRVDRYARWMSDELSAIFVTLSYERAKRLITLMTAGGFVLGFLLAQALVPRLLFGAFFALAGFFVPQVFVLWTYRRRLAAIDSQLVDTLRLMSNGLKAGMSLQQALELVTKESKPPISDEFGRVMRDLHLGVLTDDALVRLMGRVPLPDLRLAMESVVTLRETGGNLSETFEVVADTVVERKKVEGKIQAMTAQGMAQGLVMCLMPVAMLVLFTLLDPHYMELMYTTVPGWLVLAVVFLLDAFGFAAMLRLVKVDV